jgi:glycosyltransferase involved in cell wall biosynthesis
MAACLPVICLDFGEPASIVTSETGVKVSAVSPEQVVVDLTAAMQRLAEDPTLRVRMGRAARRRVQQHFDWAKKAAFMMECYEKVRGDEKACASYESCGGAAARVRG